MAEIREGLAANLSSIEGIQVSPYMLSAPTPPAIHVVPSSITYDRSFHRGMDEVEMTVQAFVALGLDVGAQMALDELLAPTGSRSVKTAIETDRTLGGKVQHVQCEEMSGYDVVVIPDRGQLLAASWAVRVRS